MTQHGQAGVTPGVCSLQALVSGCVTGRNCTPVSCCTPARGEGRRPSLRLSPSFSKVGLYLCHSLTAETRVQLCFAISQKG